MAKDLDGGGCCEIGAYGKGFEHKLLIDLKIDENPPRSTVQGSSRILRNSKGNFFIGTPLNSNAKKSKTYLKSKLLPFAPIIPYKGALSIHILYNFSFNKSEKKKVIKKGIIPHVKRPDSDNLMKGLLDVMSECRFWIDDSQLSNIKFEKNYSISPCLAIKLYQIVA